MITKITFRHYPDFKDCCFYLRRQVNRVAFSTDHFETGGVMNYSVRFVKPIKIG